MIVSALGYEWHEDEGAPEEVIAVGSRNHSYLQSRLTILLGQDKRYMPFVELSIDATSLNAIVEKTGNPLRELIPNVAIYPKFPIDFKDDELRVDDIPLLIVEILSPHQGVKDLIDKFKHYFALGVQSCWLVYPYEQIIAVYNSISDSKVIAEGEVSNDELGIAITIEEIFS